MTDDEIKKLRELLGKAEWEHRYRHMGYFDGQVVTFLKKNHQDLLATLDELEEWKESASMACENPCGDCPGCHLADEVDAAKKAGG